MIFFIILPNSVYFQHQEYMYPYIFGSYKMLNFKAYTVQMIGFSISKIYLHPNESELVIKMEDFILVLPYFQKSMIWAHCARPWADFSSIMATKALSLTVIIFLAMVAKKRPDRSLVSSTQWQALIGNSPLKWHCRLKYRLLVHCNNEICMLRQKEW